MTVKLELKPDIEAGLLAQAQAQGVSLDRYLESVLESAAKAIPDGRNMTPQERAEAFEQWAISFGENVSLPDEAISRESLYPDRW